ncbi:hypothetical protein G6F38_011621 [Rhizopus arrhizus]|nr:hypothetical protein G6F38_011621 [Rhizopus arrhizus]
MHIPTKRFSVATSTLDWEPTQETTLQILESLAFGQPTYLSHRGSSIIDLFMSNTELIEPSMTIHHDLSLDSNHKLVSFSFQAMADVPRLTRHPRYTWHLAMYTALDETCGRVTNPGDLIRDFWTNELQAAIDFRELCYRKWQARATVRRLITQRRRATWKDFCKRLASYEYTKAISKISRIRKNCTLKPTFSTPEGPQHAADTMASHLEKIFSGAHQRTVQCNEITTPALPFAVECPITADDISSAIRSLPVKKAPGLDHLRIEMLHPIQHLLQPLLLHLFQLNWAWSYGSPSDPGNYRPISLTTIFRKILERCIQHTLRSEGPPLDIAQGVFREPRSALDQATCLSEICQILRSQFRITPVLAFLDIKSAYDTVNRNFIWKTLSQYISPPLLGLLRNLFDDVQIEVLLSNATSRQFRPNTGVLQGSILSPYLYSVYINQLPA